MLIHFSILIVLLYRKMKVKGLEGGDVVDGFVDGDGLVDILIEDGAELIFEV